MINVMQAHRLYPAIVKDRRGIALSSIGTDAHHPFYGWVRGKVTGTGRENSSA